MPCRILIAEEHEECRELFAEYLRRFGYEVLTASDQNSCIDLLRATPSLEILVISRELPTNEGILFPGEWLDAQRTLAPAIIVLTADMEPTCPWRDFHWRSIEWITRPFRLTELLTSIQSIERAHRSYWHSSVTGVSGTSTAVLGSVATSCDCQLNELCCSAEK